MTPQVDSLLVESKQVLPPVKRQRSPRKYMYNYPVTPKDASYCDMLLLNNMTPFVRDPPIHNVLHP
jgi:hypothetical protein